tara:strand:- start:1365 stop:1724 length:360 start_codon:yes stop_codon:yes gene_type:complete
MQDFQWTKRLFKAVDSKDSERFVKYLTEDVSFRFGNGPTVKGKAAVLDSVNGLFAGLKGLEHQIIEIYQQADTIFFHGFVTYTRLDSSTLKVAFANVFKMQAELIKEYLIFADTSELFK